MRLAFVTGALDNGWRSLGYDGFLQKQDVDLSWIRHAMRGSSLLGKGLCRHGDEDSLGIPLEHIGIGSFSFLALKKHVHFDFAVLLACLVVVYVTSSV